MTTRASVTAAMSSPAATARSASAPSCRRVYTGRTRHYHFKVQAPGSRLLTTQLYFPNEAENRRDSHVPPRTADARGGCGRRARRAVRFRARRSVAGAGEHDGATAGLPGEGVSGVVGPVPSRRAGAGVAARRGGAVHGDRRDHARRAGAGGDRRARAQRPADRDGLRRELSRLHQAGRAAAAQGRRAGHHQDGRQGRADRRRPGRHRQDRQGRARASARRAFRHRLCQADGPADGRHLHHRGVAGHLDLFSLGHGLAFLPPIREGGA